MVKTNQVKFHLVVVPTCAECPFCSPWQESAPDAFTCDHYERHGHTTSSVLENLMGAPPEWCPLRQRETVVRLEA